MKFNFKMNLKVSAFYLEKQKSFIPKKYFLGRCQYQNKKGLFTDPIFSEGFDTALMNGNDKRYWQKSDHCLKRPPYVF